MNHNHSQRAEIVMAYILHAGEGAKAQAARPWRKEDGTATIAKLRDFS
jgi:hypothetical protein